MTLDKLADAGYKLRAWTVSNVRGMKMITVITTDGHGRRFVSTSHCSEKKLIDSEFTAPIRITV